MGKQKRTKKIKQQGEGWKRQLDAQFSKAKRAFKNAFATKKLPSAQKPSNLGYTYQEPAPLDKPQQKATLGFSESSMFAKMANKMGFKSASSITITFTHTADAIDYDEMDLRKQMEPLKLKATNCITQIIHFIKKTITAFYELIANYCKERNELINSMGMSYFLNQGRVLYPTYNITFEISTVTEERRSSPENGYKIKQHEKIHVYIKEIELKNYHDLNNRNYEQVLLCSPIFYNFNNTKCVSMKQPTAQYLNVIVSKLNLIRDTYLTEDVPNGGKRFDITNDLANETNKLIHDINKVLTTGYSIEKVYDTINDERELAECQEVKNDLVLYAPDKMYIEYKYGMFNQTVKIKEDGGTSAKLIEGYMDIFKELLSDSNLRELQYRPVEEKKYSQIQTYDIYRVMLLPDHFKTSFAENAQQNLEKCRKFNASLTNDITMVNDPSDPTKPYSCVSEYSEYKPETLPEDSSQSVFDTTTLPSFQNQPYQSTPQFANQPFQNQPQPFQNQPQPFQQNQPFQPQPPQFANQFQNQLPQQPQPSRHSKSHRKSSKSNSKNANTLDPAVQLRPDTANYIETLLNKYSGLWSGAKNVASKWWYGTSLSEEEQHLISQLRDNKLEYDKAVKAHMNARQLYKARPVLANPTETKEDISKQLQEIKSQIAILAKELAKTKEEEDKLYPQLGYFYNYRSSNDVYIKYTAAQNKGKTIESQLKQLAKTRNELAIKYNSMSNQNKEIVEGLKEQIETTQTLILDKKQMLENLVKQHKEFNVQQMADNQLNNIYKNLGIDNSDIEID